MNERDKSNVETPLLTDSEGSNSPESDSPKPNLKKIADEDEDEEEAKLLPPPIAPPLRH